MVLLVEARFSYSISNASKFEDARITLDLKLQGFYLEK